MAASSQKLTADQIRRALASDPKALELWKAAESQEVVYRTDTPKEALVKAHLDVAEHLFLRSPVSEDVRLPIALQSYRRVRELDPENAQARSRVQTIVNVYEAWGKPVPK